MADRQLSARRKAGMQPGDVITPDETREQFMAGGKSGLNTLCGRGGETMKGGIRLEGKAPAVTPESPNMTKRKSALPAGL